VRDHHQGARKISARRLSMLKPLNSIETSRARLAPMLAIVLAAAGLCACSTAPIERSGLPDAPVAFKERSAADGWDSPDAPADGAEPAAMRAAAL
jgi:hypothetical protein